LFLGMLPESKAFFFSLLQYPVTVRYGANA
jgi:hypothetical protein